MNFIDAAEGGIVGLLTIVMRYFVPSPALKIRPVRASSPSEVANSPT
jgi:hypothetical protein